MDPKLQPLSIVSGWLIEWNQFYEIEPSDDTMQYFDSSSLLHLSNHHALRAIDLEWRPEADANGEFILRFLKLEREVNPKSKKVTYSGDWENPLFEIRSKNRLEIIAHIEALCLTHKPNI